MNRYLAAALAVSIVYGSTSALAQLYVANHAGSDPGFLETTDPDGSNAQMVLAGLGSPYDVAVDRTAQKIYWTDSTTDTINRSDLDGGNAEVIVTTGTPLPHGIALDHVNDKVYWIEAFDGTIWRCDEDGGNVELFYTDVTTLYDIEIDPHGGKVYWSASGQSAIRRCNLDGTAVETIVGGDCAKGIALDLTAGKLYVSSLCFGTVRRFDLDGSNVEFVFGTGGALADLEVDPVAGKLYWTDKGKILAPIPVPPAVGRVDLDGSNQEILVLLPESLVFGIDFIGAPYPGSGDDLELLTSTGGGAPTGAATKLAAMGDTLTIQFWSPGGSLNAFPYALAAQLFTTGSPPPSPAGLPELHLNPNVVPAPAILLDGFDGPFGPSQLPAAGITIPFTIGLPLAGSSAVIQVISIAGAAANNGIFASGDGHEIVFL